MFFSFVRWPDSCAYTSGWTLLWFLPLTGVQWLGARASQARAARVTWQTSNGCMADVVFTTVAKDLFSWCEKNMHCFVNDVRWQIECTCGMPSCVWKETCIHDVLQNIHLNDLMYAYSQFQHLCINKFCICGIVPYKHWWFWFNKAGNTNDSNSWFTHIWENICKPMVSHRTWFVSWLANPSSMAVSHGYRGRVLGTDENSHYICTQRHCQVMYWCICKYDICNWHDINLRSVFRLWSSCLVFYGDASQGAIFRS